MANSGLQHDQIKLVKDLKIARVRVGWMLLFHFLNPPIASLVYGIKIKDWTPFALATLAALFTTLISYKAFNYDSSADAKISFIVGFMVSSLLNLIPMGVSFWMYKSRIMCIRARNNIVLPRQADFLLAEAIRMHGNP
jgi:hypothetical protein